MKIVNSFFLSFLAVIQLVTLPHVRAADVWDFLNSVVPPPTDRIGNLRGHKKKDDEALQSQQRQLQTDAGTGANWVDRLLNEPLNDIARDELDKFLGDLENGSAQKCDPQKDASCVVSDKDIIISGSSNVRNHCGNLKLKERVLDTIDEYYNLPAYDKTDKTAIVRSIFDAITEEGGRFLKCKIGQTVGKDYFNLEYFKVDDTVARDKIGSTYRNYKKKLCSYDPESPAFRNSWKQLFGSRTLPTRDWWKNLCDPDESQPPAKKQKRE